MRTPGSAVTWRDADWEAFYESSVQHIRKEVSSLTSWKKAYAEERIKQEVRG